VKAVGANQVRATASPVPADIAIAAVPTDERIWVPQLPGVWMRPLMFNTVIGQWHSLLRVTQSGVVSRHRHPGAVYGYVIKGSWRYLEHQWIAESGHFVYEPPGETHTLVVPADCPEMITYFDVTGALLYLDEDGHQVGYEDVFTKIDMCRAHYQAVGLGADYVDQFVR